MYPYTPWEAPSSAIILIIMIVLRQHSRCFAVKEDEAETRNLFEFMKSLKESFYLLQEQRQRQLPFHAAHFLLELVREIFVRTIQLDNVFLNV